MKTQKLTPGPIQQKWLKTLREHPERQWTGSLGKIVYGKKKMCCLCQLADIAGFEEINWDKDVAIVGESAFALDNHKEYGLNDCNGKVSGIADTYLSALNDEEMTWPEIADYVEANFENVFIKSY